MSYPDCLDSHFRKHAAIPSATVQKELLHDEVCTQVCQLCTHGHASTASPYINV